MFTILKPLSLYLLLFYFVASSISCSDATGPQNISFDVSGQMETDLDYAVLKPDGTVWTWGENWTGTLGNGTMKPCLTPKRINDFVNIKTIRLQEGIALAADSRGNIWFWGNRFIWEEPPGFDTNVTVPTKISFLKDVKKIVISGVHASMLKKDGTVWQIEMDHNFPTKYLYPEQIPGMKNITSISGELALISDGKVVEFPGTGFIGANRGALDNNIEIRDVTAIENQSRSFTVILKKDSTVWAWGLNNTGNLGNDSLKESLKPVRVGNLEHIVSISVEGSRCLALKRDGSVWFWGMKYYDSQKNRAFCQSIPVRIPGIDNACRIHASAIYNSLILTKDGTCFMLELPSMTLKKVIVF